ncbi:predicted protein [Lichtheimia corymbifera JMRC:FSU:9682]|uniref:Uncharacterized protein n=1 Tax=Lichtheimia corymbifera JMRC:FSU:9682 TaxID=1263082 RepID=A0A068SCD6_9FUNG|nr:predicted protein [Lichtheimia corymbifera JMRC:FSU:9682]
MPARYRSFLFTRSKKCSYMDGTGSNGSAKATIEHATLMTEHNSSRILGNDGSWRHRTEKMEVNTVAGSRTLWDDHRVSFVHAIFSSIETTLIKTWMIWPRSKDDLY